MVQAQVGPPSENQAVTKQIVAAFSFALNTNLNTTPRQLVSAANGSRLCSYSCVQILGQTIAEEFKIDEFPLQTSNDESKENNTGECFLFCPAQYTTYRFRFSRAYIKPEPNKNTKGEPRIQLQVGAEARCMS